MPVPDFQSLMLPALKAFASGEETPLSKVRERIAAAEGLTAHDVQEMLPSGRQRVFGNRVSWAVIYMERAGLVERVRRGVYRLTEDGKRLLSRTPSRIDMDLLGGYPAFRHSPNGRNGRIPHRLKGRGRNIGAPPSPKRPRRRSSASPGSCARASKPTCCFGFATLHRRSWNAWSSICWSRWNTAAVTRR